MHVFIETLKTTFEGNSNSHIARQQKAYMRHQFEYYGLNTELRRQLQKPFLVKEYLPEKKELNSIVKILWNKPQREYQYFAQELTFRYVKQIEKSDILLFEFMVTHKSWWDTVDFIATKLIGAYFKKYPEQKVPVVQKWIQSNNIWLQRSALIFQLKYKNELDKVLISTTINALLGTNEFFINKAIGWILREYSRTDPYWVVEFTNKTALSNLSNKEALRLIKAGKTTYE